MKASKYILGTHQRLTPCESGVLYGIRVCVCICITPELILSSRSENVVLGCCGFHGDVLTVMKILKAQLKVELSKV